MKYKIIISEEQQADPERSRYGEWKELFNQQFDELDIKAVIAIANDLPYVRPNPEDAK